MPLLSRSPLTLVVVALVTLGLGTGAGLLLGQQFADDGNDEPLVPRAATPTEASVRIEGDDTDLKRLLAGLFSAGGSGTTVELVVGELPAGFPDFPAIPGSTLLGGQASNNPFSPGTSGTAVYGTDVAAEAALEALKLEADAAGWWEPEQQAYMGPFGDVVAAQFCGDDWAKTGLAISASAAPDGTGGSHVLVSYFVSQGGSTCDAEAFAGGGPRFAPPALLLRFQQLRPEGAEPDFRFGSGMSGSDSTFSTSAGFRYDGSALIVARFYARELASLGATTSEPIGHDRSAVLQVSLIEESADGDREFDGWVIVTRFEDEDDDALPVIRGELALTSLADGLAGQSGGGVTILR